MQRRHFLLATAALALLLAFSQAQAHHGWTGGETRELVGVITDVQLGNPHGVLILDVDGETWTVEVGQPWRNDRAGLGEGDLATGVEVRVSGEHSGERLLKVEQLWIGDEHFVLYPDRI
ncbi:DUF6152 family protein [Halomonas cerina]|uniref:Uncharacterized protein n=1 Tax=Halomonas cerina TaxID=447424 RepID=A0A839VD88_9GAMM|nr:DUF6152 family protein [Halomonas cerina]MBB3192005.1 hypothetical protein [Halomonas cerina]